MNEINYLALFQILYSVITVAVVAVIVIWAIRNGQFTKMKNASNLPLEIETENEDENTFTKIKSDV